MLPDLVYKINSPGLGVRGAGSAHLAEGNDAGRAQGQVAVVEVVRHRLAARGPHAHERVQGGDLHEPPLVNKQRHQIFGVYCGFPELFL